MRNIFVRFCLCLAIAIGLVGGARAESELPALSLVDHPLADKIWLVKEQRFATREQLAERLVKPRYVFLGETHDNPQHHQYQAWALEQLAKSGRKPAIALEMLDEKQGAQLKSLELTSSTQFFDTVSWEKTGWPGRPYYAPVIDFIVHNKLPIVPANLDRQALRELIGKQESAALADLADYMKGRTRVAGEDEATRKEIVDFHCGMLPDAQVPKLMYGQQLRDAIMARAMIQYANNDGAVLIAGAAHARTDRGAPAYVRGRETDASIFALTWLEVDAGVTDPAAYAQPWNSAALPFDAVWFTPAVDRPDPCAEMKAQFKKHAEQQKSKDAGVNSSDKTSPATQPSP